MKIYIVQIDMSDAYDGTEWENAGQAFQTREAAQANIEFMIGEYGIESRGLRIVDLELVGD